jgi:3-oxoacyl-[acyl-carrier protein] reductase
VTEQARVIARSELRPGLEASFERDVGEADILAFADNSGDRNPLHVDPAYAASTTYQRRIAHGAFQVGLASALLGMHLPGRDVLLNSLSARFPKPLLFPCRVRVEGRLRTWNSDEGFGRLGVSVCEIATGVVTAEIDIGFTLHARDSGAVSAVQRPRAVAATSADRPIVLVTGAAGGLGTRIVELLAERYRVLALVRETALPEALDEHPAVERVRADLDGAQWQSAVTDALGERPLYGVVHAAWPSAPRGGLLSAPESTLELQLRFATSHVQKLARLLVERVDASAGGRFVALGSTYGTARPPLQLASYSLGKATLEHAVRLLAPELARSGITANTVCPSFVAVGMNRTVVNDRALRAQTAKVPLGRLCLPDDVAAAILHLLSREASFVSGQTLLLTGAEL